MSIVNPEARGAITACGYETCERIVPAVSFYD